MVWRISMWTQPYGEYFSATLQAAVHLGQDYSQNQRSGKNQPSKYVKQLFRTTGKRIKDHVGITGLSTADWNQPVWRQIISVVWWSCSYCETQILRCCVWEASVLQQSKLGKTKLNGIWRHVISKIWIESTGSWWNSSGTFSQDSQHWGVLDEIQKMMTESRAMQRKDHLHVNVQWHWRRLYCEFSQSYWVCSKIHARTLVVSGAWTRQEMVRNPCKQNWWAKTAEGMMVNFAESGQPVFRASSALERGELKSQGKGATSIHFNGKPEDIWKNPSTIWTNPESQCTKTRGNLFKLQYIGAI